MKTVRVRIAVAVNADGKWSAFGHVGNKDADARDIAFTNMSDYEENHDAVHFIEADVPVPQVPQPQTIKGEIA